MTVSARIEIGSGGHLALGAAASLGAADSPSLVPSGDSKAESFRAGLQSLLASLGSSSHGFGAVETDVDRAGAPGGEDLESGASLETAGGKISASGAASSQPNSGFRLRQEIEKGSAESIVAALSSVGTRTGRFSSRSAAGMTKAVSMKSIEKKPPIGADAASAIDPRSADSMQDANKAIVADPSSQGVLPAAIVSDSRIAAAMDGSTGLNADVKDQSTRVDLNPEAAAMELAANFVSTASTQRTVGLPPLNQVGAQSNASAQIAGEDKSPSKLGQNSSLVGLDEDSSPALNGTELPMVPAPVKGVETLESVAQRGSLTQPLASNQKSTHSHGEGQSQTQTLPPFQNEPRSFVPGDYSSQTIHPVVQSRNPLQNFHQGLQQLSPQPGNQQTEAVPSLNSMDELNPLPGNASTANSASVQLSSAPPIADRSGSGGGNISTQGVSRSSRGGRNVDSLQKAQVTVQGQSSVPGIETSSLAREVASAHSTVSTAGSSAGSSSLATGGSDTRDAFAELDAESAPGKPGWVHMGAQRAEAGFQDPTLGWVGVRADLSRGGVHAELMASSSDAAQALGGHMAGLNSYLAERHTPVETLTLTAPESGWAGLGGGKGGGEGMQQGAGQQRGHETAMDADAVRPTVGSIEHATQPQIVAGLSTPPGGVHISVMA